MPSPFPGCIPCSVTIATFCVLWPVLLLRCILSGAARAVRLAVCGAGCGLSMTARAARDGLFCALSGPGLYLSYFALVFPAVRIILMFVGIACNNWILHGKRIGSTYR